MDEINKVKSENEARIVAAQDNYRKVKTENEVLKEKVDVLFKLGRSYINKSKQSTKFDDASHSTQDTAGGNSD